MNQTCKENKRRSKLRLLASRFVDITFKATILTICTVSIIGAQIITNKQQY